MCLNQNISTDYILCILVLFLFVLLAFCLPLFLDPVFGIFSSNSDEMRRNEAAQCDRSIREEPQGEFWKFVCNFRFLLGGPSLRCVGVASNAFRAVFGQLSGQMLSPFSLPGAPRTAGLPGKPGGMELDRRTPP